MTEAPEEVVAWTAVPAHAPVIAADGEQVGHVLEVAALANEDIFHGVVFHHAALGRAYLAPAVDIVRITNKAVYLSVDSQKVRSYAEFYELHVERLGLRGIFSWKHLGWKSSAE